MIFDKDTIGTVLNALGVRAREQIFLDNQYNTVGVKFIQREFSTSLSGRLHALGYVYSPESWDCDDYAREAWCHANNSNNRLHNKAGIAFGMFAYHQTGRGYHMINLWMTKDKRVHFYEPQLQREIKLTQEEISSCGIYIF